MAEPVRDLAARLGLLKECEVCLGRGWMARWHDGLNALDSCTCPSCVGGQRLPTEAEVRQAIFAEGRGVTVYAGPGDVAVILKAAGAIGRTISANQGEAAADDLVLLALLRALEG